MIMSNGKNVLSADNQQERLDPYWIVGFVDGEGCFYAGINRHNRTLRWQLLPEFRVVQHERNENTLHKIKSYFGFGIVGRNNDNKKEFRVRGLENLNKIVEFFNNVWVEQQMEIDGNRLAYYSDNMIYIYDFETESRLELNSFNNLDVIRLAIEGDLLAYFANTTNETGAILYLLNISTVV